MTIDFLIGAIRASRDLHPQVKTELEEILYRAIVPEDPANQTDMIGKVIEKKIRPEYFRAVRNREKNFELRKDDSDYQVGDMLKLREWDGERYTGNVTFKQITYILRNCPEYGLKDGYCILGIQPRVRERVMVVLDG